MKIARIFHRLLSILLVVALCLISMPTSGMAAISAFSAASPAETSTDRAIPEPFSLAPSALGDERNSGVWWYALREMDGYAVITGYTGDPNDVSVPVSLDGHDVVGLASGALDGIASIHLHGNILNIAEDAFGSARPTVRALSGTLGLYYAASHGFPYSTGKDYDLVPGVIDFTDAASGRIVKRGESHIWFSSLEAMRLSVGSIFFIRDSREVENAYQVVSLFPQDDGILVEVKPPKLEDAVINYSTVYEYTLTEEDMRPAEGVIIGKATAPETKTGDILTKKNPVSIKLFGWEVTAKNGWTSTKVKVDIVGEILTTVVMNCEIKDGKAKASEVMQTTTFSLSVTVSDTLTGDLLKKSDLLKGRLKEAKDEGKSPEEAGKIFSEPNYSILNGSFGNISFGLGDFSTWDEISDYMKDLDEKIKPSFEAPKALSEPITIPGPMGMNIGIELDATISLKGVGTITYSETNMERLVWKPNDIKPEEGKWTVQEKGSRTKNSITKNSDKSLTVSAEITGDFHIGLTISIGWTFVKAASLEVKLGIELTATKTINTSDPFAWPCTVLQLSPYISVDVSMGLWVGKDMGAKIPVWNKKWTLQDLVGDPDLLAFHVNPMCLLNGEMIHHPSICPLKETYTISYDTRTVAMVTDKTIAKNGALTNRYNATLPDDKKAGKLLGWAYKPSDTEPTAAKAGGAFKQPVEEMDTVRKSGNGTIVIGDITLYGIWEHSYTVTFDCNGGTPVPAQTVPAGGFITMPDPPACADKTFICWVYDDGLGVGIYPEWDFQADRVQRNVTLHAKWDDGEAPIGSGAKAFTIGSRTDVSESTRNELNQYSLKMACLTLEYEVRSYEGARYAVITGVKGNPEHIVIPEELPNLEGTINPDDLETWLSENPDMVRVSDIKSGAFSNCTSLKSVRFETKFYPQFTTDRMFSGCTSLEYVKLPALEDGVIGKGCFYGCTSLKCVDVREGLMEIEEDAFMGSGIKSFRPSPGFTVSKGAFRDCLSLTDVDYRYTDMTTIRENTFSGCTALVQLNLGSSVSSIEWGAFGNCSGLKKLYIPDNVKSLSTTPSHTVSQYNGPFHDCTGLEEINVGGVRIQQYALNTGSVALKKLVIRKTATLEKKAFTGCSCYSRQDGNPLNTELIFEEGVTTIPEEAFSDCSIFTSIVIPRSITSIGKKAFYCCANLTSLEIKADNRCTIDQNAFQRCDSLKDIRLSNVCIENDAFSNSGAVNVTIDGCNIISTNAFLNCNRMTNLQMADVSNISYSAFGNCTSLKKLYIPDSVITLGVNYQKGPFNGCTSLEEISVGGVSSISQYMLPSGCKKLKELRLRKSVKTINKDAFSGVYSGTPQIRLIMESVQEIGTDAFKNCSMIKEVVFSEQLQNIRDRAFYGCSGIQQLRFHGENAGIYSEAFAYCTGLKDLDLTGVRSLGSGAFSKCTALESIYIPDTLTNMPYGKYSTAAFAGCTGVKTISAGGITTLYSNMLVTGSKVLETLILRESVKTIAEGALSDAYSGTPGMRLIMEGVRDIGTEAFKNCTMIREIRFSDQLQNIRASAFYGCSGIEQLKFHSNVESISSEAFAYCTGLKDLDLTGVRILGSGAFSNCTALEDLYIPDSMTSMPSGRYSTPAFVSCRNIKTISIGGVTTLQPYMLITNSGRLRRLTIRGTVKTIEENALVNSFSADEIILEEGVQTIGPSAFAFDNTFASIVIPSTVTSIGNSAFKGRDNCATEALVLCQASAFGNRNVFNAYTTVVLPAQDDAVITYCDNKGYPYRIAGEWNHTLTIDPGNGGQTIVRQAAWHENLSLDMPVWAGHTFSGWYLDEERTKQWTDMKMPGIDLTLYGGWDIDIYLLTLDLQGGAAEQTQYTIHAGDPVQIPAVERENYYLAGWALDEEGAQMFDGIMPYADTQLYAVWTPLSTHGIYRDDGDHATLTGYRFLEEEQTVVALPDTALGLPLTTIEEGAFRDTAVTVVYIPASVTDIAAGAFCDSDELKQIQVSLDNPVYASINGVLYSSDRSELIAYPSGRGGHFDVPMGVTTVTDHAFDGSLLSEIQLPETLTDIGAYAFRDTGLKTMVLPAGIHSVGGYAFYGCRNLIRLIAGGSPETVGDQALSGTSFVLTVYGPEEDNALKQAAHHAGALYNPYELTVYLPEETISRTVEAGEILVLPEENRTIGNEVFTAWYTDQALTIPLTASVMPAHDLKLWPGSVCAFSWETTAEGEMEQLRLTGCILTGKVTVPEMLEDIAVTSIGSGCFGDQVTSVIIGSNITDISDDAFAPDTILCCAPGSFAESWALEHQMDTIVWTHTVAYVTGYDISAESAQVQPGTPIPLPELTRSGYLLTGWFTDENLDNESPEAMPDSDLTLYAQWTMEDETLAEQADALIWELYDGEMTITGLRESLKNLTIPSSLHGYPVTAVADHAFAYQTTLLSLTLPDTVMELGEGVCQFDSALELVTLPTQLEEIPADAFSGCSVLGRIDLPDTLRVLDDGAFEDSGLVSLTLPANLEYVSATALRGCANLLEISVESGNSFYESRDGVLYDIADGILVHYPSALQNETYTVSDTYSIGAWAFYGAVSLKNVILSADVLSFGDSAFAYSGLTAVPALGQYFTRIPDRCFAFCSDLTEANLPDTLQGIGSNAFTGCGLTEISIPSSVMNIGIGAFDRNTLIRGTSGSTAHTWACNYQYTFLTDDGIIAESVVLTPETVTLKRGESTVLTAQVLPENADTSLIVYSSLNDGIAQVDENGNILAIGGGETLIAAIMPGGAIAYCRVSVEVDVETITLNNESLLLKTNTQKQMTVALTPLKVTNPTVLWTSDREDVASVDENGLITAISAGETIIRATAHNGLFAETAVTVYQPITSIEAVAPYLFLMSDYNTGTIQVRFTPEDATDQALTFISDSPDIVTVDENGHLQAVSAGTAVITVSGGRVYGENRAASCTVTVQDINQLLTLPASLNEIGEEAFCGMTSVQGIIVGSNVRTIGSRAFADMTGLLMIFIPEEVTDIADDAFSGTNVILICPANSPASEYAILHDLYWQTP